MGKEAVMSTIDKSKPVLVTGASGYVASWIVKMLLKEGINVNATVRDPSNMQNVHISRGAVPCFIHT